MAVGISPQYAQENLVGNLSNEHFLIIAIEAAEKLNWEIGYTSETGFIAYTKFSMSSYSEQVTVRLADGFVHYKSECTGIQLVDWGKNKRNIQKLIEKIEELQTSISNEEIELKYAELKPKLLSRDEEELQESALQGKKKLTSLVAVFKPAEGYYITPILITINILIYILMLLAGVSFLSPSHHHLIYWGANYSPLTTDGEAWRLLTNTFLHGGILHLLMNMYALIYIGFLLEPYLGKVKFLAAYLLAGIAASTVSLFWNDMTISVGASGAIFGMYGVFLALLTTNFIERANRKAMLTSISIFVGYSILSGLSPNSGVDNAAHIGGLISGLIIGYSYIPSLRKPFADKLKYGIIGGLTLLVFLGSLIVYRTNSNDMATYESKLVEFARMESIAMEVFRLPDTASDNDLLNSVNEKGIPYWKECLKLIDSFDELDLTDEAVKRNKLLRKYSELRLESYDLLRKGITINSHKYDGEVRKINLEIEKIIYQLESEMN